MKYFDYESVAREAKIPPQKMRKLMKILSAEFPKDTLMRELHVLRACMAVRDGHVNIDDILKNKTEEYP